MKKKYLSTKILILLILAFPPYSPAAVNLRESSFDHSNIDLSFLKRTYNSRSDNLSSIGYGWCFEFDIRIDLSSPNERIIKECGALSEKIRFVKTPNTDGWINTIDPKDRLIESESEVIRPYRSQVFDKATGLIKNFRNFQDRPTRVLYDRLDRVREIRIGESSRIQFEYNTQDGFVKRALNGDRNFVSYKYDGLNLVEVNERDKKPLKYSYDEFHNLSRIVIENLVLARLVYDNEKDRVIEYTDRGGCREHYSYREETLSSIDRFIANVERRCSKNRIERSRFEFLYTGRSRLQRSLAEMLIEKDQNVTRITFDEVSGRTVSIENKEAL